MPKMKTRRGATKRFKVTGSGKLLRRSANQAHKLEKKSPKQKRSFAKNYPVDAANAKAVKRMLGRS